METIYFILLTLFIVLSLFMILLVLIQKGRGGGLSAAFGGVGGNTAFGAKTGDVLTWATSIVFGVFIVLAICMNWLANSIHELKTNPTAGTQQVAPVMPPLAPSNPGSADNALSPATAPATQPVTPSAIAEPTTRPATTLPADPVSSATAPTTQP
ncbi:MAG: preprotein translocase subunit SecG [Burkholderiales bacterium]|nr:preprotein translocase subunit SecG [Phycisphaerae bacterium]